MDKDDRLTKGIRRMEGPNDEAMFLLKKFMGSISNAFVGVGYCESKSALIVIIFQKYAHFRAYFKLKLVMVFTATILMSQLSYSSDPANEVNGTYSGALSASAACVAWAGVERIDCRTYHPLGLELNEISAGSFECFDGDPDNNDECAHASFLFKISEVCPSGTIADPLDYNRCVPIGKDEGDPGCPAAKEGNPINLGVGNKYQTETDYLGRSVYPLMVRRTFNSFSAVWQFHSQINAEVDLSKAVVVRADGKKLTFPSNGVGGWTADPDVTGTMESFEDASGNITSWRYTTLGQQVEDYDAAGKLTSITHRSGLSHAYTYTATDITVTHSEGGALVYQLNTEGRITGFTDPDNNQYTYGYDLEDHLASITYPTSGGTRIYHYEDTYYPNTLTGITDANGDRFATWGYDNQGRAISSSHNNGADLVTIDYTYLDDAIDPRATATNPLGKQTTYHFTTIHGVRKVTQIEGHQSNNCAAANKAYTYDANGFLETKTDWQGNITRYTRNTKGQELTRVEAENTPEQRTITTEWHATFNVPTKITESEQETTFTYDANGNQLTRVITDIP